MALTKSKIKNMHNFLLIILKNLINISKLN